MENRFQKYCSHVVLLDFYKNSWISLYCKFCLCTPRRIIAVSADISRVCDVVYGDGVNRTVLKIYGAKSYQFDKWVRTDMVWRRFTPL